jgi:hypothetical protein
MLRLSRSSVLATSLALLLASPALAFNSPLSDESIREAYFLGQRHDESVALFLARYKQVLRPPDTGPYISSIEFLTPLASLVLLSSQRINYSAQQAEQEHRSDDELVAITVEIQLTQSYSAILSSAPTSARSGSPIGYTLRSPGFWRDFDVQVLSDEENLEPTLSTGRPTYLCNDTGCVLTGATLRLELPAKLFTSDSATVQVIPPAGPEVAVNFDLVVLR